MARGIWEMFNEVHRNWVPRSFGHQELFQEPIEFMPGSLRSFASSTWIAKFLDERMQIRPKVIASYCFEGLVLPYMTCKDMVVFELKDFESQRSATSGTNIQSFCRRRPLSSRVHLRLLGEGSCAAEMGSRGKKERMSLWSFSMSMMTAEWMIGVAK